MLSGAFDHSPVAGGMIRSIRGARNGDLLARPLEEVKLNEVIQLLDGSIAPAECVNNPGMCSRSKSCVTLDIWGELKQAMDGILKSTTLQDLVERQRGKEQIEEVVYYI
jgi:Rrf2 family cysteine metabolism transcriptional repressor